jgi:hypothetical protein
MGILGISVITCGSFDRKMLNAIVMTSSSVLKPELPNFLNYKVEF